MSNECVIRNNKLLPAFKQGMFIERIKVLKKFVNKQPSIDLGCGAFMPFLLKTTHACDNGEIAQKYLKERGWKGEFEVVDLRKKLPYKDKQFEILVCSEVIEHLNTKEQITNLFREIDRISNKWIVTTPYAFFDDPDHNFYFGPNDLFEIIPFERDKFIIYRKGVYYYITNDKERVAKLLKIPNDR